MGRPRKMENMFKPTPVPKTSSATIGQAGYDNPRENVDNYIKTKVNAAIEGYFQRLRVESSADKNKYGQFEMSNSNLELNLASDPSLATVAPDLLKININNGDAFTGSGNAIRFVFLTGSINTGTTSNRVRAIDARVKFEGDAIVTGDHNPRGFNANVVWNSTGTCSSIVGIQNFMGIGGGAGVTAGLVTETIANRALIGYNANDAGSVTDAYAFLAAEPRNTDGTHTITNYYGYYAEDFKKTGVTNSYGIYIDDQSSGGYAIKTGTGFVEFGGRVMGNKGSDIASSSTITLGEDGNYFDITGTTQIDYITTTDWQSGSIIILQFDGSVTVAHNSAAPPGSTAPLLLSGAVNFSATANDTLMLIFDGTTWRELSRTVI